MDIYIKAKKKINMKVRRQVRLMDLGEVIAPANLQNKLEQLLILNIPSDQKQNYLVSITDIIKRIQKEFPVVVINSVGEQDTIVEYYPTDQKENQLWLWTKIIFVIIVLFAGAATAIMSFHTDAQIPEVLKKFYEIFFNKKMERPYIIDIPYSIGIAVGIIVFFNHFSSKKFTDDPTPIQVEMNLYENDVEDCIIDTLSKERESDS